MAIDNIKPIAIASESYDLHEQWLSQIGPKYLDMDNINTLKVGLFGYINEVMARATRDGAYQRNALYDESFLNTASKPSSIYNYAKMYNYSILDATPASMKVNFAIEKSNVIDKGELDFNTGVLTFKITKDSEFFLGTFKFMLEHDIIITGRKIEDSDDYAFSAKYDITDGESPLSNLVQPYLKMWIQDGIIFLLVDIWQVEKSTVTFDVYSEDVSETLYFNSDFANQIAYFKVLYTLSNGEKEYLTPFFNNTFVPDESKYCYYSYDNIDNLQVYFSNAPNSFRPQFNSNLTIEMYTTLGSAGNFAYSGDINFTFNDENLADIAITVTPSTDSTGGKDRPTLKELKTELISKLLARENLITESDLNNFFNELIRRESVNDSKLLFIRKRDDIIKRMFGSYLLLKDSTGLLVPTNTIDLKLIEIDGQEDTYVIPTGSTIVFDTTTEVYRLLGRTEDISTFEAEGNHIYVTPFLLEVRNDPFPRVAIMNDMVDRRASLEYTSVNSIVNAEFIVNYLDIVRDSMDTEDYQFTLNLSTTLKTEAVVGTPELDYNDRELEIKSILKKDGILYGYFDLILNNEESLEYIGTLTTNNTYDDQNRICLIDCVKDINTGELIHECWVDENISVDIGILYNGIDDTTKFGDFNKIPNIEDYCVATILSTESNINLYLSMNSIIESNLTIKDEGDGYDMIKSIPVVGHHYFINYENYIGLYSLLNTYSYLLMLNFNRLENNTSFDIKFFNTFGNSTHYTSKTTNTSITLNIKLFTSFNKQLDLDIKNFIIDFVEDVNESSSILAISNLLQALENGFEEIKYIEFIDLNGTTEQKVLNKYPNVENLTKEQLINYVPEYLNITMSKEDYDISDDEFNPSIFINYI